MNTAPEIISYAEQHGITMSLKNDRIVMDAPEDALTDEFLETARAHKAELILTVVARRVCQGLDITPEQFLRVLTQQAKQQIVNGQITEAQLRNYAEAIDSAIKERILLFYVDETARLLEEAK